jgi:cellulose synthase/poly-beta-1,6-N-acetylglucosamine synthase-like glycosyltransferase
VNSPDPNYAYANGAFMLMPRATYDAIGRHEVVRATLNEDMHMARLAKRAGLKLRVIRNEGLYRVRMYTGFKQIWRGWSRIFYGCFGTLVKLVRSLLLLSVMSILPWVILIAALATGYGGAPLLVAALAAVAAQQSVLWRFYHVSGIARPWALTYPLGAAVCLGMIVSALGKLRGSGTTNWRGTTYRGGAQTTAGSIVNP